MTEHLSFNLGEPWSGLGQGKAKPCSAIPKRRAGDRGAHWSADNVIYGRSAAAGFALPSEGFRYSERNLSEGDGPQWQPRGVQHRCSRSAG